MNLLRLGVQRSWLSSLPKDSLFPLGLSPAVRGLWPAAIGLAKSQNPRTAWAQAIEQVVELAENKGIYPFRDSQSNNDKILLEFIKRRRAVVKFIDRNSILQYLRTRTSKRSVTLNPNGFVLNVDVTCVTITDDPTFIDAFGLRRANGRREKILGPGLVFYMYNEGAGMSQRWHIGYTMTIDILPSIPGKPLATDADIEKFIMDVMYMPILRCYRPVNGLTNLV